MIQMIVSGTYDDNNIDDNDDYGNNGHFFEGRKLTLYMLVTIIVMPDAVFNIS